MKNVKLCTDEVRIDADLATTSLAEQSTPFQRGVSFLPSIWICVSTAIGT